MLRCRSEIPREVRMGENTHLSIRLGFLLWELPVDRQQHFLPLADLANRIGPRQVIQKSSGLAESIHDSGPIHFHVLCGDYGMKKGTVVFLALLIVLKLKNGSSVPRNQDVGCGKFEMRTTIFRCSPGEGRTHPLLDLLQSRARSH